MKKVQRKKIIGLVAALILVVGGSVLFIGAVSGWFDDPKVTLDTEYYCVEDCDGEFTELSAEDYEELVQQQKSFVVFVDQNGCTTADRLREYVARYAAEAGVKFYRMMFEDVRESSLHDSVRFYPSVAIISKGKVVAYLRADSDDDAGAYNNYDEFIKWIGKYL